jgi:hypothetical protein
MLEFIEIFWLVALTGLVFRRPVKKTKVPRGTVLKVAETKPFKRSVGVPKGKKLVPKAMSEAQIIDKLQERQLEE